jgi:hypothetical protein
VVGVSNFVCEIMATFGSFVCIRMWLVLGICVINLINSLFYSDIFGLTDPLSVSPLNVYAPSRQHYTALYSIVQCYTALYSTLQHCTTLYSTIQHCTTLYSTIQHSTALYNAIQH